MYRIGAITTAIPVGIILVTGLYPGVFPRWGKAKRNLVAQKLSW